MLKKKIISLLIAVFIISSLSNSVFAAPVDYGEELKDAPITTPSISFTDLPTTHWAYKYIAEMVNKKVLEGYPDNKFRPNNMVSRAELATILIKAAGLQAKKVNYSSFSDIKVTDWYSPFVETAKDYLTGYRTADGSYIFNPTTPALREDITVALVKLKGYDVARLSNRSIIEAMFKDFAGISESAKDYVAIAVENGLVSGYEDETFRPQATITRAEAATLLWRAYQFGNDNKGVGRNEGVPTTTTQPISITSPSSSQAAKFSVDTLVGAGQGDVDGPVSKAKINQIDSMAVDKDDNVFFLDGNLKKVRKFNNSNGTVETFKTMDKQFDFNYTTPEKSVSHYDHADFSPSRLAYNQGTNKLYLLGQSEQKYKYDNDLMFEISPTVTIATYVLRNDDEGRSTYSDYDRSYSFIRFSNENSIYFGVHGNVGHPSNSVIYKAEPNHVAEIIADDIYKSGIDFYNMSDVIIDDRNITLFDSRINSLSKIQLFPRKVDIEGTFKNVQFESITTYSGKFYLSSGATIYELTNDGKLSIFIDGKDLTYNDGNPIQKINQMNFDSKGNIIFYDDQNKAIRRINL
jgi:hypothetical protein